MAVNASNEYITTEELNYLAEIVLSPKFIDDKITYLDRIKYPTYERMKRLQPHAEMQTTAGGIRINVAGNRNQRFEWYDGAQRLKFYGGFTSFHLDWFLGKGHFGDLLVIDVVERAGIKVKRSQELRLDGSVSRKNAEVVVNILKHNQEIIKQAMEQDLARRTWEANTDAPKCFAGLDAMYPSTSNSIGLFGTASRSLPLLRHQLITGVTGDNVDILAGQMERLTDDGSTGDGSYPDLMPMGDNWFDMLTDLYKGNTTREGRLRIDLSSDKAATLADKLRIGMPNDCFVGPNGALCYRDPIFRKLDAWNNPAVPWANRWYWLNSKHTYIVTEREIEQINHGMPYDQEVNYSSSRTAMLLAGDAPGANGIMIKN